MLKSLRCCFTKTKIVIMATWQRQPQEQGDQKYFFNGSFYATERITEELTQAEIQFIYNDVQAFAKERNGIDYLQVYVSEKGKKVWIIDQLNKSMIESGDYNPDDNYCTLLFPEDY
jgi:hypothetical protein